MPLPLSFTWLVKRERGAGFQCPPLHEQGGEGRGGPPLQNQETGRRLSPPRCAPAWPSLGSPYHPAPASVPPPPTLTEQTGAGQGGCRPCPPPAPGKAPRHIQPGVFFTFPLEGTEHWAPACLTHWLPQPPLFHQGERGQGTWLLQHGRGGWGGEKGDRLEAHSPNPRSRVCGHGWACQNQSRMRLRSA